MRADVSLRGAAYVAAPLALAAGWNAARTVARRHRATVMHGHWVMPGGVTAAIAAPALPLVISLHGSDVFVAETRRAGEGRGAAARFDRAGFVTACSDDLARRAMALGADAGPHRDRAVRRRRRTLPSGPARPRRAPRASSASAIDVPLVLAAGRLVRKKGFEYLIDAAGRSCPAPCCAIAGDGTLDGELRQRARHGGVAERVRFLGDQSAG